MLRLQVLSHSVLASILLWPWAYPFILFLLSLSPPPISLSVSSLQLFLSVPKILSPSPFLSFLPFFLPLPHITMVSWISFYYLMLYSFILVVQRVPNLARGSLFKMDPICFYKKTLVGFSFFFFFFLSFFLLSNTIKYFWFVLYFPSPDLGSTSP